MGVFRSIVGGALGGAAQDRAPGRGLLAAGIGLIAARVATRSLPGAALVGGGLLAKYFWDRRNNRASDEDPGMNAHDIDMAVARTENEPGIAEGAISSQRGLPETL